MKRSSPYGLPTRMDEDHNYSDEPDDGQPLWSVLACGIGLFLSLVVYGCIFYAIDWIVEFIKHWK